MAKWSLDLDKYAEKCKEKIDETKKRVAFALYSSIAKKTPVDTGRARGNWHITVGNESFEVLERKGLGHYNEETDKINGSGDKPIFIQNNLPYIVGLEYGRSKQAPNGMVGLAMANVQKHIDEAVRGLK